MNATNSKSKKQRRQAVLSLFLVVAILASVAFAFLSATDSKTNVFNIGNVAIKLHEDDWYNSDGSAKDDNNHNNIPDFAEDVLPGEEISKTPQVENIGTTKAHTYLVVGIPTDLSSNVYTGDGTYEKDNLKIIVKAYAIQEEYNEMDGSESIWNTYVSETGVKKIAGNLLSEEEIAERVELFKIVDLNTTNWTPMEVQIPDSENPGNTISTNTYCSADGHNYYFFRFNNDESTALLNANAITEPLFTKVKLIEDIGEPDSFSTLSTATYYVPNDNTVSISNSNISEWTPKLKITSSSPSYALNKTPSEEGLYEEGKIFNWMYGEVQSNGGVEISENAACEGEIVSGNVNLFAVNSDYSDGKEAADYLKYTITTDPKTGEVFAMLTGADPNASDYPSTPTTVVVPDALKLQYCTGNSKIGESSGNYYKVLNGRTVMNVNYSFSYETPYSSTLHERILPDFSTLSLGDIVEIPVRAVNVTSNDIYGKALMSIAKKVAIPDNVAIMNYSNYDSSFTSVLENINVPRACTFLGEVRSLGKDGKYDLDIESYDNYLYRLIHSRLSSGGLYNHPSLTNVKLPTTLRILWTDALERNQLGDVNLPQSLQVIGDDAFYLHPEDSSSKISQTIPASVKSISLDNFKNYNTISFEDTDWYCYDNSTEALTVTRTDKGFGCQNLVFNCTLSEFRNSLAWASLKYTDLSGYNTITFTDRTLTSADRSYCSECDSYYYPVLDNCLCEYLSNDEIIYYNNHVIGSGNSNVATVTVKSGTTAIDKRAFSGYRSDVFDIIYQGGYDIQEIILPSSLKTIEDYAFEGCYMRKINIPSDVTALGNYAFEDCSSLRTITLSNGLRTIGEGTFRNCNSINEITLPNTLTYIGAYAFSNCRSLGSITIPDSVTYIGNQFINGRTGYGNGSQVVINISQSTYDRVIANNPTAFDSFDGILNIT